MSDRQLDALVAEKVMGCRWYADRREPDRPPEERPYWLLVPGRGFALEPRDGEYRMAKNPEDAGLVECERPATPPRGIVCPMYSASIDAAWLVVEAMRAKGWLLSLDSDPDGTGGKLGVPRGAFRWHVMFWSENADKDEQFGAGNWPSAWDPSAPQAICRAALFALGVPVPPLRRDPK